MKHNRFICLLCLIIALLIFSACANVYDNVYSGKGDDANQSINAGTDIKKTPKFYYLSSAEDEVFGEILGNEEDFAKADGYMFSGYSKKIVDGDKVNTTKTIEGIGTFIYKDSELIQSDPDPEKALTCKIYDNFVSEDGSKDASFLAGTDIMTFFYNRAYNNKDIIESGERIDEQRAKEIANAFIAKVVPNYSLEEMYTTVDYDSLSRTFYMGYAKTIGGMITDEDILVGVTEYGQIEGYNGENVNGYDGIALDVTDENVNAAITLLGEALSETELDFSVFEEKYVVTDYAGNVYLSVTVEINGADGLCSHKIYIPI